MRVRGRVGMVLARGTLVASLLAAAPAGAAAGATMRMPIDHVVVLMQENRSFDSYFGQLNAEGQPGDTPAAFDRYGIRVPEVVVSPFVKPHYVSHTVRDHTSILRFIETRFGLPALTRRDAAADPMLDYFDFSHPAFATPPPLPPAPIDVGQLARCLLMPSNLSGL